MNGEGGPPDPLGLEPLFSGGGECWLPLLAPVLERSDEAEVFIGRTRSTAIVPVRELTFQALKPNPPERWRVVVFGQSPYPRIESATGIAMFDNAFADWGDSQFGKAVSIRCLVKAACMRKHGVAKETTIGELRKLLAKHDVVPPPRWFQSLLSQGVLLLNASLTTSPDESLTTARHARFWKPVVEAIVEEILKARGEKGIVFAWWGSHARALRTVVERLEKRYPGVRVRHVDHCNPAAMGEAFCEGDPFGKIDQALASLGMEPLEWLPSAGWETQEGRDQAEAERLGDFIEKTRELHKLYLERLQDVGQERLEELVPIDGVMALAPPTLLEAMTPLLALHPTLAAPFERAKEFARKARSRAPALNEHEIGALHLYTVQSVLYQRLNATLRDRDRAKAVPWKAYLRLFLSAVRKLGDGKARESSLWRGVARDLRRDYVVGRAVTWWGVSSCTPSVQVARGFLGSSGGRTLFEVTARSAVSIKALSAFTGEDEYVLAPGTRLDVVEVTSREGGLFHVRLQERAEDLWGDAPIAKDEPAETIPIDGPSITETPPAPQATDLTPAKKTTLVARGITKLLSFFK